MVARGVDPPAPPEAVVQCGGVFASKARLTLLRHAPQWHGDCADAPRDGLIVHDEREHRRERRRPLRGELALGAKMSRRTLGATRRKGPR